MIKRSYKNNIVLNYIYEFLLNRNFVQALWPTYLVFRGMSLIEVGVCESFFHLTSLFFETPTGAIADVFGRRFSRIIGLLLKVVSIVLLLFTHTFFMAIIAFIVSALSYNMESGSDTAFVYDSLLENNEEKKFTKVQGYREVVLQVASLVGVAIGGILADIKYEYAYGIEIAVLAISFIFLLLMKEVKGRKIIQKERFSKKIADQYKISFMVIKNNKILLVYIFTLQFFSASITASFFYLTNYWQSLGYSLSIISLFLVIESLAGIIAGIIVSKVMAKLGKFKLLLYMPMLICLGLICLPFMPLSVIALSIMSFCESILYVAMTKYINDSIESEYRATILSFSSMVFSVIMIIVFPVVGLLGESYGLKTGFLILAIFTIIIYLVYLFFLMKGKNKIKEIDEKI